MRIDWATDAGALAAVEATLPQVERFADALAHGYNDPRNASLMGHAEIYSPADVIATYEEFIASGARAFLLFRDDRFVGDADLRNIRAGFGEFAFMIGDPDAQGKGLGTRFATMIHAFGFRHAELHRIFASIVPHNTASRRVFEKLGYAVDSSPTARGFADEPGDVVMAVDQAIFEQLHGDALRDIRIGC